MLLIQIITFFRPSDAILFLLGVRMAQRDRTVRVGEAGVGGGDRQPRTPPPVFEDAHDHVASADLHLSVESARSYPLTAMGGGRAPSL